MQLSLDETVLSAVLVLLLGRWLNYCFPLLRRINIPQPVSGGILASLLALLIYQIWGIEFYFDMSLRDALLLSFFTCIGLSARLDCLAQGGRPLIVLMLFCVGGVIAQNLVGIGIARVTDLSDGEGLLLGSVSLFGGHGTSVAWAQVFEQEMQISHALEIGIASATLGLIMGGLAGGPLAQHLISRYQLNCAEPIISARPVSEIQQQVTGQEMYVVLMYISTGMILGSVLSNYLAELGMKVPTFLCCLLTGMLLTNVLPRFATKLENPVEGQALPLVAQLSLGLFLSMSLISMKLWLLSDLALPMLFTLVAQIGAMLLLARFGLFFLLGRNYNSAVLCAGYMGMGLGALPNAMANMNALASRYGAAPMAFMILPLANAFFVDISNALILQMMVNWLTP